MQFIQKTRWLMGERRRSLQRVCLATEYLMRQLGLEGHCEAAWSLDDKARLGLLLRIETLARIPWTERENFQTYFKRKLSQLRDLSELDDWDFQLVITDAADRLRRQESRQNPISSRRVLKIIKKHNKETPAPTQLSEDSPHTQSLEEFRATVHRRWSEFKQSRPLRDSDLSRHSDGLTSTPSDLSLDSTPQPEPIEMTGFSPLKK